jgi:hypothetical protein
MPVIVAVDKAGCCGFGHGSAYLNMHAREEQAVKHRQNMKTMNSVFFFSTSGLLLSATVIFSHHVPK